MYNKKSKSILKYVTAVSSNNWKEGLFSGNGKIGINVLGGAGRECIAINHTDLWWQGSTGVLPDVSDKVKNISKNLDTLSYREAETVLTNALNAKGYKPQLAFPLPLCDFVLNFPIDSSVYDYSRSVNMENGEVSVEYKSKGIRINRDVFVSRANDTICYQIASNSSKKVCLDFTIVAHDKTNNRTANFEQFDINIATQTKTDKDFVVFCGRNDDGTDFGCVAKVLCYGGVITKTIDKFSIKNADKVVVLAKVFVSDKKDVKVNELQEELNLIKLPYDKLLKEHAVIHSKFLNTTELMLPNDSFANMEQELFALKTTDRMPLSLVEKLYNYGKYLFACSYDQKISPCGLFVGDYKAFRSSMENYLQLQRMYNFSYKASLSKVVRPIFDRFYDNLDDYKKSSTRLFGCKGIYIPSLESPDSGLPGSTVPGVIMNFNVCGFVSSMIYQYYLQTDDIDFIKEKGFELIEEAGLFYEDHLKINKTTKTFESTYGISPFNTPSNIEAKAGEEFFIASNCAIDFVCAKYVFNVLVNLSVILNKDDKEIEHWQKLLDKIPDMQVDKNGLLKEYNSNVFETNHSSIYIPHLFPYNIGLKPFESKRDFDELVSTSVVARYKNCFGKFYANSLSDMSTCLATAGDASNSFEVVNTLAKNFMNNALIFASADNTCMGVGAYEPFASYTIDNNLALCITLQNMFVNSNKNNVALFRSLPKDFVKGSMLGLVLSNQVKVDIEFNTKRGIVKVRLKSPKNISINLSLPNGVKRVKGVEVTALDEAKQEIKNLSLQSNKTMSLKIYYKNIV